MIDRYPIDGKSPLHPNSIRQIPGAFESEARRGGRSLTLDEIENTIFPSFTIHVFTLRLAGRAGADVPERSVCSGPAGTSAD